MMVWSLSRRPRPGGRITVASAILMAAFASPSEAGRPATMPPKAIADGPSDLPDGPSEDDLGESAPEGGRDADDPVEALGTLEFVVERQTQAGTSLGRPEATHAAHRAVGRPLLVRRATPTPAVDLPTRLCRWTC